MAKDDYTLKNSAYVVFDCLKVRSTHPFIDNVQHILLFHRRGHHQGHQTQHGQTSIDDFCLLGQSQVKLGHVSVSRGLVDTGLGEQGIPLRRRAKGRHQGDSEKVSIRGQDDRTFVGNRVLARNGGQGTPILETDQGFGIRNQSVSLAVGRGADKEPTEHGVSAIPLFGLDGRSPAVLGKGGELFGPVGRGVFENFGGTEVGAVDAV